MQPSVALDRLKELDGVGADIDAGAELGKLGRLLIDPHLETLKAQRDSSRQPAEARADNGNVARSCHLMLPPRDDGMEGWISPYYPAKRTSRSAAPFDPYVSLPGLRREAAHGMKRLPEGLSACRRTPIFTEETIPAGLLKDHEMKAGVWGVIHVVSGTLRYVVPSHGEESILSPGVDGIVVPETPHHIAAPGSVSFYVEFWR